MLKTNLDEKQQQRKKVSSWIDHQEYKEGYLKIQNLLPDSHTCTEKPEGNRNIKSL